MRDAAQPLPGRLTGTATERGFTLIEVLIALVIFATVTLTFLAIGAESMMSATEVQNWRIAREIATTYLSEMQAGARETTPEPRRRYTLEEYPGFEYEIVIGEARIEDLRTRLAEQDSMAGPEGESTTADRLAWQREREQIRRARSQDMSLLDYQDQLREEELDERIPSEDEFEDVAVVVHFPRVRAIDNPELSPTDHFILRAKISTMAIERLTPDEVQQQFADRSAEGGSGGDAGGGLGAGLGEQR